MKLKSRAALTALLALAVALPVIATADRFPDVPADHQYADAIRWASDPERFRGNPLFKGKPDGNFDPKGTLTEGSVQQGVERLFDSSDEWTRAETAGLFYYGYPALRGENPGRIGGGGIYDINPTFTMKSTGTGYYRLNIVLGDQSFMDDVTASYQLYDRRNKILYQSQSMRPIDDSRGVFQALVSCDWATHIVSFRLRPKTAVDDHRWVADWDVSRTLPTKSKCLGTTTTTAPTTTVAPTTTAPPTDPLLEVAIRYDRDGNFVLHWVRPGWEEQGWKWRLLSEFSGCGFSGGAGSWRTAEGYTNRWLLDSLTQSLCVERTLLPWRIEIVWDNGYRFVSPSCFIVDSRIWDCPAPTGWETWPNYQYPAAKVRLTSVNAYSSQDSLRFDRPEDAFTSFDVWFVSDRPQNLSVSLCGLTRRINRAEAGSFGLRMICDFRNNNRRLVVKQERPDLEVGTGPVLVDKTIIIPEGNRPFLNSSQLSPEIQGSVTQPEGSNGLTVRIEVIVGNSAVAKRTKVSYFSSSGSFFPAGDTLGIPMNFLRYLPLEGDRFVVKDRTREIAEGTIYRIQIHEPGAPTQYFSYSPPAQKAS